MKKTWKNRKHRGFLHLPKQACDHIDFYHHFNYTTIQRSEIYRLWKKFSNSLVTETENLKKEKPQQVLVSTFKLFSSHTNTDSLSGSTYQSGQPE